MDTLTQLLSSRVKAEIFRLLFGTPGTLHVREIARRAKLNDATVRQELKRLMQLNLIESKRDGNRVCLRANTAHPLYPELHGLVQKTSGLADILKEALGTEGIEIAFVFGSLARNTATPESDVDLMVLGTTTLRKLAGRLAGVSQRLAREINIVVLSPREFAAKRKSKEHFLTSVLSAPKLFVIGDENELAAMGR